MSPRNVFSMVAYGDKHRIILVSLHGITVLLLLLLLRAFA